MLPCWPFATGQYPSITSSLLLQGETKPTFVIQRMSDLVQLLQREFELQPPPVAQDVMLEAGTA